MIPASLRRLARTTRPSASVELMADVKTKVHTVRNSKLPALMRNIVGHEDTIKRNVTAAVHAGAVRRCPVSATGSGGNPPGYLRDSIQQEGTRVWVGAYYGVYVNNGHTVHKGPGGVERGWVPANPFFTQACEVDGLDMLRYELARTYKLPLV